MEVPLLLTNLVRPFRSNPLIAELDVPVCLLADSSTQRAHAELYEGARCVLAERVIFVKMVEVEVACNREWVCKTEVVYTKCASVVLTG